MGALLWGTVGVLLLMGCASTDPTTRGLPPGLSFITSDEHYDLTGSTWQELRQGIRRHGPKIGGKSYAGEMFWRLEWDFDYGPRRGECEMKRVDITIYATIILPQWDPTLEAPEDLVEQWGSYLDNLSFHEEGHRAIAIEAGREMIRTLRSLRTSSCYFMNQIISGKAGEIVDEYSEKNRRYDAETAHGLTQGARWPPPALPAQAVDTTRVEPTEPTPSADEVPDDACKEIFVIAKRMPELIGGLRRLQQQIRYPEEAREAGVGGRVVVRFVVNKRGAVVDAVVVIGRGYGLDEEALRVVRAARFEPGKQRDEPVCVKMSLPITFYPKIG